MPTIGKATIDVDYDGDDLPRQARAYGKRAGAAQSEAFGDELRRGSEKTNADLGKRTEKAGTDHGNRYGINFSDSMDRVMKRRTQTLSDRIATVFSDNGSMRKYVADLERTGKGVGKLTDDLDVLYRQNVLTDLQYGSLTGTLRDHVSGLEAERQAIRDNAAALETAREATARTREENGRLANARLAAFWEDQQDAARRFSATLDHDVTPKVSTAAHGLDDLGGKVETVAVKAERGRSPLRRLGGTISDIGGTLGRGAESLGARILAVGDGAGRGGDSAGRGAGGFSKLLGPLSALSRFDPGDNLGQLLALIVALAPQIAVLASAAGGGLLILAGGVAALALAVGGGIIGFSNLFGDIKKLPGFLQAPARAVQEFVGHFDELRAALQRKLFDGLTGELRGLSTSLIPTLKGVFGTLGEALNSVLRGILTDLNSSGFKRDLTDLFAGAEPVIEDLGRTFRLAMGIIGQLLIDVLPDTHEFTSGLNDMLGAFLKFLKSPEGNRQVQQWLTDAKDVLGKVGEAIGVVAGALGDLVTPEHIDETIATIKSLGQAGVSLAKLGDALSAAVPVIAGAIAATAAIFQGAATITEPLIAGVQLGVFRILQTVSGMANTIGGIYSAIGATIIGTGKAVAQAATGDFAGAALTIAETAMSAKRSVSTAMGGIGQATGNAAAVFDALDSKTQTVLSGLATRLGLSGDTAKAFGGRIVDAANISGVSLQELAKAKSLDDLGSKLGVTGQAADYLLGDFRAASAGSITAVSDLSRQSQSYLGSISSNMGLTGKAGDVLQLAIARATGGSKTALKGLADDKSLDALIADLSRTGGVSKTEFANKIVAAASESGVSIDKLPPKIQALISKYGDIPSKVSTKLEATDNASGTVASVRAALDGLNGKVSRVFIDTVKRQVGQGTAATGGVLDSFGSIARQGPNTWRRYAAGGITGGTTHYRGSIVGEAGPEAIVPLSGALGSVDRSVRALAAFARGRTISPSATTSNGRTVNVGNVNVNNNGTDARQVASSVLDRLGVIVGVV